MSDHQDELAELQVPRVPWAVFQRLEQVIDEENEALARHDVSRCEEFNQRKRLALQEVNRLMSGPAMAPDPGWQEAGAALRAKLRRNSHLLRNHLLAVAEITDILTISLNQAESDGTYTELRKARAPC